MQGGRISYIKIGTGKWEIIFMILGFPTGLKQNKHSINQK